MDKATSNFVTGAKNTGLPPTPPNSISPNLPAHNRHTDLSSPPPIQIDQVDLQDAVEHAAAQDQPQLAPVPLSKGALSGLENAQAITPSMLAKNHLPNIILGHGPIAIRHVMACLTQSVPGFSRIPPAKARRLVVAALESRAGGGPDGIVEFEKVGWGRWDAHVKDKKPGNSYQMSPPLSEPSSYVASYSGSHFPIASRRSGAADVYGRSFPSPEMQAFDEGLEDMSMSENEADNMSLDGSDLDSLSDDTGEDTEPEDWAAIGADALRKASIPTVASGSIRRNYNLLCIPGPLNNSRRPSNSASSMRRPSGVSKALPQDIRRPSVQHRSISQNHQSPNDYFNHNPDSMELDQTPQEKEAVEALLRMGSL